MTYIFNNNSLSNTSMSDIFYINLYDFELCDIKNENIYINKQHKSNIMLFH